MSHETKRGLLDGITVVDLAVGMAGALTAKFLAEMGAQVYRVPPQGGDPFFGVYPAYRKWRNAQILADVEARSHERLRELIANADICLVGGEDFPEFTLPHDARALAKEHDRLIVVEITGAPKAGGEPPLPAVDILAQARAGFVFDITEKPVLVSCQPANFGAMFHALAGIGAALLERERCGRGQVVSVSLVEGVLTWLQPLWTQAERPNVKFNLLPPKQAQPIIAKCRDGNYIHIVLGGVGTKYRLYKILGIDDPSVPEHDPGLPRLDLPPEQFFGDIELLQQYIIRRNRDELLREVWAANIVAEPVLAPGECWDDAQVRYNGIIVRAQDGSDYVGNPATWKASAAPGKGQPPSNGQPLSGVTAIDFGAFVAGPSASVWLGDLGADVIKVEPLEGDPMRGTHRFFAASNRGKRSIAIDLKKPEGIAIAHQLCGRADIVCSNFRAGAAARLGIDADSLHPERPETIVLNNTGYGVGGPKASNPAFDPAIQAISGLEVRSGGRDNPPLFNRLTLFDFAGGLIGTVSMLFALYRRARVGDGAELTVPLLNVGVFMLSDLVRQADGTFDGPGILDRDRTGFHPAEKLYQAKDGWIAICTRTQESARALTSALNVSHEIARPRSEWGEPEAAVLAQAIGSQSTQRLVQALRDVGVWCEECRTDSAQKALADETLRERGTIYEIVHPQYGKVRGLGALFSLSNSRIKARGDIAAKGQHTREVLQELGYQPADIDSLYERKIVA